MKNVNPKSRRIFALGILLLVAPLLLKDWFLIPDFYKGFMMGTGILLEIASRKKSEKLLKNINQIQNQL